MMIRTAHGVISRTMDPNLHSPLTLSAHHIAFTHCSTAAGIVLVEGFNNGNVDLEKGSKYIKAAAAADNNQGIFELASLNYTGAAEPYIPEDEDEAMRLFEKAAKRGHTCSEFMLADMLIERGSDLGRATELLYKAGEKGHRFSRQQILAILDERHKINKK